LLQCLANQAVRQRISRKKYIKHSLSQLYRSFIQKSDGEKPRSPFENTLVSEAFLKAAGVSADEDWVKWNVPRVKINTFPQERALVYSPTQFATIGENETKKGLHNGMVSRDVTRDIRIIEFCLGAPMECFSNRHGESRRIVRIGFADKFPPGMLDESFYRGLQSADWIERLRRRWSDIYPELEGKCLSDDVIRYIDRDKVISALEDVRILEGKEQSGSLNHLLWLYFLSLYIEMEEKNIYHV